MTPVDPQALEKAWEAYNHTAGSRDKMLENAIRAYLAALRDAGFWAAQWRPIGEAPKDGTTVFGANWQTGQRGVVHRNAHREWELVDGLTNMPMGVGFYPTHFVLLLPQPEPPPPPAPRDV